MICYPSPDIEMLDSFAKPLDLPGIPRLAKLSDNLYRGGLPTQEGFETLRKLGVRTIVDLHGFNKREDYARAVESGGFRYILMPLAEEPPSPAQVGEFISIIDDSAGQPVFVHCKRGKVRTGVMLALYRIIRQGWSNEDAFNEMLCFGYTTFHRETFFFGSCEVHTDLTDFIRAYRPPATSP